VNGEWVILSPRPVTLGECLVGAATTDPDLRIASLWDGGAVLISGQRGAQLTVTGSRLLEHAGDAERILGVDVDPAATAHWTDAHARDWEAGDAQALITAIAAAADGHAHRLSTEGHGGSEVELQH
jgi:hypothetical protein